MFTLPPTDHQIVALPQPAVSSELEPSGDVGSLLTQNAWVRPPTGATGAPAQTSLRSEQSGWKYYFNPSERFTSVDFGIQPSDNETRLVARISQSERRTGAKILALEEKIDALASVVRSALPGSAHSALHDPAWSHETGYSIVSASDVLNAIADERIAADSNSAPLALEKLQSVDPEERAAAARALSFIDPDTAKSVLPDLVASEQNEFVKAVISGALSAAVI